MRDQEHFDRNEFQLELEQRNENENDENSCMPFKKMLYEHASK